MQPSEAELRAREATATLLDARERRALRWSIVARLVSMAMTVLVVLPATGKLREDLALLAVIIPAAGLQLWVLRELRHDADPGAARWITGTIDVAFIVLLPVLWHVLYTTPQEPLMHLTRHNYTVVCTALIALNVAPLRPALPAVVTGAAVIAHVVVAVLAVMDPRLAAFEGGVERAMGVGLGEVDVVFITPLFLTLTGVLLTLATRAARATVLEAVAREQAEHDTRQRQLEALLEARMAALGELVAGVEHEINNPLGAMRSATDTGTRAAQRLRDVLGADGAPLDRRVERALSALRQALALSTQGGARVAEVMASIKGFVRLDTAELQRTDLARVIGDVLALVRPTLGEGVELSTELQEGVELSADPRRLAQALSTVVRNAAEAIDGAGTVRITLSREQRRAVIRVRDSGRGMTQQQLDGLFDVDFSANARVQARFGLPVCRSILHRHGGDVHVESEPGQGTTVTLALPLGSSTQLHPDE
ncbi:MAG: HAMP domain-containing sensor histidine kinase [Myxococcales bacterium]|nr:HAMP domain-containing sensor histidine kinase [Myxococcales bacterium]